MSATTRIEGGAPIKAGVAESVQPQQAPASTRTPGRAQPFAADGKSSVNHAGLRTAVRGAETMAITLDRPGVVTAQRYLSPYSRVERIAGLVRDIERSEWAEEQAIDLLFSAPRHEWNQVLRYMDQRTVYDSALILGSYKSLTNFLRDNLTGTESIEFRDWVDAARFGRTIPRPRWPGRVPYPRYPLPRYPYPRYPRYPDPLPRYPRYPRYPRNPGGGNRRPGGNYPRNPGGGNRRPGGNYPRNPGGGNRRPGGNYPRNPGGGNRRPGGHTNPGRSRPLPRTGGGNRSGGNRRPGSSR